MPAKGTSKVGTAAYLQERCAPQADGCVVWTGTRKDGYGRAVVAYRGHARPVWRPAHVVVYEMWKGPVPAGLELDHGCRNRACVNPDHLEPVTHAENVRRGDLPLMMRDPQRRPRRQLLAKCKNGHVMAGNNLGHTGGRRVCRACKRETSRRLRNTPMENIRIVNEMAAQGDVLIRKIAALPSDVVETQKGGRLVLGHSETGHDHVVENQEARLFEKVNRDPMICYLAVDGEHADLVHHRSHDTHQPLRLSPGVYEVRRQEEYTPEGWRRVED
jgi:hypothetical protein